MAYSTAGHGPRRLRRAFGEQLPSSSELLDEVDRELAASETRLREMERYVTSDTFTLRSRFRQL